MSKLTLIFSGKIIQEYEVDRTLVIGRDSDVDISIDNLGISRRHAQIEKRGSDTSITDLGSNNGTFVNGKQIKTHNLHSGDEIILGKYSLLFKEESEVAKTSTAVSADLSQMTMGIDVDELKKMQENITCCKKMKLRIVRGRMRYSYPFSGDVVFTLGSSRERDIYTPGWRVADMHAVLVKIGNDIRLISLSKWNKTLLNGKPVKDARVKVDDSIQIGATSLTLFADNEITPD